MNQPAQPLDAALYEPISPDAPCGAELPREEFAELAELCDGKAGGYNMLEERENPRIPPDFNAARTNALKLLKSCRDMRPLARLVQIETNLNGVQGLHSGLHLLDKCIEDYWEGLHPGPLDDTGAMNIRRQVLNQVLHHRKTIAAIEQGPMFKGPANEGPVRLRDMKIASGKAAALDGEMTFDEATLSELVAAANGQEIIKQAEDALKGAAELAASLGKRFAELLERPIAMGALISELNELAALCEKYSSIASTTPGDGADTPAPDGEPGEPGAASTAPAQTQAIGAVNTDEEANTLLEEVLAYYAVSAPSSPVALILLKVHELRTASFLEWVQATGKSGPDSAALELDSIDASRLAEFGGDAPAAPAGPDRSGVASDLFNRSSDVKKALKTLQAAAEKEPPEGEAPAPLDFEPLSQRLETLSSIIDTARDLLTTETAPGPRATVVSGRIKSRRDVKAALESLAAYQQTLDPASAVQTILRRTKTLVDMDYMDILSELSPKGGNLALRMVKAESKK